MEENTVAVLNWVNVAKQYIKIKIMNKEKNLFSSLPVLPDNDVSVDSCEAILAVETIIKKIKRVISYFSS